MFNQDIVEQNLNDREEIIKAIKSLSRPLTKKEQEYARMTPFEFAAKVYPQTIPMLNKYNLL